MTWVYEIESGVMVRTMADYPSFSIIILNLTRKDIKALSFLRKAVTDKFKTMGGE